METNPVCKMCQPPPMLHNKHSRGRRGVPMMPLLTTEHGVVKCCPDRDRAFGKMIFECPNCGRKVEVPHQHIAKVLP